jgi:CheY-like chemotaxis protein
MNCLFVDDDIDDQEIFSFAVRGLNKPVSLVTAGDGLEALEILKADKTFIPDCIFLDLNMPRMNGKECLPELRKLPWLKEVPIIIYTTSSEEKDKLETRRLGASDFMTKESSIEGLKTALDRIFHKHKI